MDSTIFNLHDFMLMATAAMSAVLALLLFFFPAADRQRSSRLLAAMLALYAVVPLDNLVTYAVNVRLLVLGHTSAVFLFGSAALLLAAPLLYLYVKSVTGQPPLRRRDALHLLPFVCYLVYIYYIYYRFSPAQRVELVVNLAVLEHWSYKYCFLARDVVRFVYGVSTLVMLLRYRSATLQYSAHLQKIDTRWLLLVVAGFLLLNVSALFESGFSLYHLTRDGDYSASFKAIMNLLGLTTAYFTFALIALLVFLSMRYSLILAGVDAAGRKNLQPVVIDSDLANALERYMQERQPYLRQNLTIEELSGALGVSPRSLSTLLNRYFNMNFFDYINQYRILACKKMLSSPEFAHLSVIDIFADAGFSSKSAFNKTFKKIVGMPPREYRRQHGSAAVSA